MLEQRDRHRAALVSRRWLAAAHAPAVLRSVSCCGPSLVQLQSLAAWLLRHGRHVRCLELACDPAEDVFAACHWELGACLGVLAAAGSMQQLKLAVRVDSVDISELHITSWCTALRQLRELELRSIIGRLLISSSLAGLSAVTWLWLAGDPIELGPAVQLPPNVEELRLGNIGNEEPPHQVSRLTRLASLTLTDYTCEPPAGFAVLTTLGRLARLALSHTEQLPASLPQLTGLQELVLNDAGGMLEAAAFQSALNAALQRLTGLTSLCIVNWPARCLPPAALAGLTRLQRCCLDANCPARNADPPPTPLPPGPWAASLRSLGASLDVLALSTGVLSAATQLSRLAVARSSLNDIEQEAFWEWAGGHPSLQRLQIEVGAQVTVPGATVQTLTMLAQELPQLEVAIVKAGEGDLFHQEFAIE
ncbi:hypothetical protein COHA_009619 [Chlorella ohadii]|uniref:Uncharacterized protein n=1 Tax=Chlorella ohadii TaxID=2649997 RepID=A0AAD5DHQ0_9CHLO|nr:hypothetical protein COHA_009619 [Chlorella ohadii]